MTEIDLDQYYFKPEEEVICGELVPPITESHDFDYDNYPSVVERYYKKYYYFRNNDIAEAHTLLNHSNGICLVGLADTHIAVKKGIKSITFDVGGVDRSKNQVSGKGKRGAMQLQATTCLAIVTCEDDTTYRVASTTQGKLVEVNEDLLSNPKLIGQDGDGYIAVVLPKLEKCQQQLELLSNEEEYQAKLKEHTESNKIV
ncbi:protein Abitram [Contarinia nasturtii]|uniref:protein Abitram n=1 Tax=Contarinia nasturtii TaxID=265458 RepID=UPI0012D3DB1D|nr:protein Abitram [Contarinia nasturtii]